ncbi:hypothetical protein [Vibrio alfacsensis]|uniref:hypothetical protein n=1 Tax=Vibrio alfacsensis TaxID=1074311 RepID=UPI001BEF0BA7|nr:hypothetical protein [Vibrio alfacsensis]BCN25760.1 hypothetical protein VYA_29520 [Vibrio alfacsensis]
MRSLDLTVLNQHNRDKYLRKISGGVVALQSGEVVLSQPDDSYKPIFQARDKSQVRDDVQRGAANEVKNSTPTDVYSDKGNNSVFVPPIDNNPINDCSENNTINHTGDGADCTRNGYSGGNSSDDMSNGSTTGNQGAGKSNHLYANDERFVNGEEISPSSVPSDNKKTMYEPANRVSKMERFKSFIKFLILIILLVTVILACLLGLYKLARWALEDPHVITKEITKEVTKEVVPEECAMIRKDGKVYMDCSGVKIDGAKSISESGIENVPELL